MLRLTSFIGLIICGNFVYGQEQQADSTSTKTPLPGGYAIQLLAGFEHEPLQGIDSIVGRITQKDGLQIQYEIGRISPKGGFALGGDFSSYALRMPAKDRLWFREQVAGGRTVHVAYSKDNRLIVSSASATDGVNFNTVAKTPAEIADVLLMALTFTRQKP